jgi:lipoprotein-anchoring transpeptidase ErfK/SrfK
VARRRRRRFAGTGVVGLILLAAAAFVALLAFEDNSASEKIPKGVSVGGIDVGGLTKDQALAKLDKSIGEPSRRPVTVTIGSRERTLSAKRAGVAVDLKGAVDKAFDEGRDGTFLTRGWRHLTGGVIHKDEPATVTANKQAIHAYVTKLAAQTARKPTDATLAISVHDVSVTPGKQGRQLAGAKALERRMYRGFTVAGAPRELNGKVTSVDPKVTTDNVWGAHPIVLTVSRKDHEVRVFDKGKLVKSYTVAVGDPTYETPQGTFHVQGTEECPVWHVPKSDWAGSLAGKVIPCGDPRNPIKTRWIGFNGGVGFHGTADIASLGHSASHGCVRMNPNDVKDLYDRIGGNKGVGGTVFVGA